MTRVPLREHLEMMSTAEAKRVNVLFGIVVLSALFVWVEIGRRLGILNHAHEKAVEVQHTYVSEDVYDQDKKNRDEKLEAVVAEQARARASRATLLAVVTLAPVVLGLVVLFANGKLG